MSRLSTAILMFTLLILLPGCGGGGKREPEQSMTMGHAIIGASDAAYTVAWKLSSAFQAGNPGAFVDIVKDDNLSLLDSLVNARTEEIFLDRPLMHAESLAFQQAKLTLYTYPIAYFPIYFLVNQSNSVTAIDSLGLRKALTGEVTNWKQLGGKDEPLTVYLPPPGEGASQALVNYFRNLDSVTAMACDDIGKLIERSAHDPGALVIYPAPVTDIPLNQLYFERNGYRIPANVETILTEPRYPFMLQLTYVTTHTKSDVAAGYLTFAVGNTGQREVMRHGYRPAAVPVRIVKMKKQ